MQMRFDSVYGASGHDDSDAILPLLHAHAPGDAAGDHYASRPALMLREVAGRFRAGCSDELEKGVPVYLEAPRHAPYVGRVWRVPDGDVDDDRALVEQRHLEGAPFRDVAMVDNAGECPHPLAQSLAIGCRVSAAGRDDREFADLMDQVELYAHVAVLHGLAIAGEPVPTQCACGVLVEDIEEQLLHMDEAGTAGRRQKVRAATVRTGLQPVLVDASRHLRRKRGTLVPGLARMATTLEPVLTRVPRLGFWRIDKVARRRHRGGGGILARLGELHLHFRDGCLDNRTGSRRSAPRRATSALWSKGARTCSFQELQAAAKMRSEMDCPRHNLQHILTNCTSVSGCAYSI